ncbi:uncharacterized protein LOC122058422 isoform X2 [Macadamia integrifolia]|uniref:uncharacterized protein LOC122058422 isoform X2 n=1 Tax=Macadamia integrifolia TaxID=60698 RepID=UPI001C52998F|nr:uncharacterized protein LOC122058422 isoform X2 [Macadamia integrifolia]
MVLTHAVKRFMELSLWFLNQNFRHVLFFLGIIRLLSSPTCPVLEALGKKLSFEIAVGLDGRVWVVRSVKWLEDELELNALHNPGNRQDSGNEKAVVAQRAALSAAFGGWVEV